MLKRKSFVAGLVVAAVAAVVAALSLHAGTDEPVSSTRTTEVLAARRDFVRSIRLSGTVEAVQATTISAPRLMGQNNNALVIMHLVKNGTMVRPGDLLVEFDRQDQIQNALDHQAELNDYEQQIKKREADEAAAKATDDSTIKQAESALQKAKLELAKNDLIPRIEADKNTLAAEQAEAQLKQLQETYALKRAAAVADIKILDISRDRSETTMKQARSNAERMLITSAISGVTVVKTTWKNNGNMLEYEEGDEVRPGQPVVEVVNPAVMRVRARVNQADISEVRRGQRVRIGLDAYPTLSFDGVVDQISPIGSQSTLNPKVRTFVVLVLVNGANSSLMPDLTASLDVELERLPGALVIPRDAVAEQGGAAYAFVRHGDRLERQAIALGPESATEAVVTRGLQAGAIVARSAADLQ
ncbi:MAG: efflux RND transporter periplasmic adaptor subunit [Vicinamibacterales bacterium]